MFLNMLKLRRRRPKRLDVPIQVPQPPMQRRVPAPDVPDVTLEVLDIHRIEADNRREQSDIGFRDVLPVVVWITAFLCLGNEMGFGAVEGGEKWVDGLFIGGLRGGEAGFVDAVVDVIVGPFVGGFNVLLEGGGEEVDGGVFFGEEIVELGVEHADDFRGLRVEKDGWSARLNQRRGSL